MFDVTIRFTYGQGDKAVSRDLDMRRLMIDECEDLKAYTGYNPYEWLGHFDSGDAMALAFGWYLATKRELKEEAPEWLATIGDFNLFELDWEIRQDEEPKAAKKVANPDDPTGSGAKKKAAS